MSPGRWCTRWIKLGLARSPVEHRKNLQVNTLRPAPPILPTDSHCAPYKLFVLYCIVSVWNGSNLTWQTEVSCPVLIWTVNSDLSKSVCSLGPPLLRSLHWLRVPERISFRLAMLVSVSLSPRLCTRLPGVRSSARLRPRSTSAAAFVVYVSARRPTHRACYHRRPSLPGGCCICLEQFAGDSTCIAVTTSFSQKTEDWTFCPVLQLFCLISVSLYWLLRDPTLLLRVLAVLGLYATSSNSLSSSSSSSPPDGSVLGPLLFVSYTVWPCL